MGRNRLYLLLGSLLTAAYIYVIWSFSNVHTHSEFVLCPIKNITGIPCPSCGTTRSVMALITGHFYQAALFNPLGYLATLIMVTLPFWLLYDLILKKNTFYISYRKAENYVKGKHILIVVAACLMLTNWIWNIYKGL